MSVHVIYYKDGAKMMRPVTNRQEYLKLRDSKKQQSIIKAVRSGDDTQKSKLLQINYSCLPGKDGALKGATTPSTTIAMDVDHIPTDQMEAVKQRILDNKDTLGLLMLELSARAQGYHLVFKRNPAIAQEQNLHWASNLLNIQFDEGAKDLTRVFFTTTAQDLLFLDDSIFEINQAEEAKKPQPIKVAPVYDKEAKYNGVLFSDIIKKYWTLYNEGKEPIEGDRNVKTFELAVNLRTICDFSLDKMLQVIPNYFDDSKDGIDEWRRTLESALKEPHKGMPYRMKQVLAALKESNGVKACGGTIAQPPAIPSKLPPLIKLLTQNVPAFYKPAVASAVFPALAAHLHGVKFRYWDNVDHEATFMNILIGRQSIGKGTIKKPIEYIMEDIRQRDIPNRQREAEWKQKNPGAKQKKDPRPTDICIQMLIDNLTDAVFNQRIVDAHNNGQRYVYTMVDEIEALKKVTSRGTTDEVGLLIRKAFDNSLAGQERVGADSVSGIAPLRWNFNASTTPPNARKFFSRMINDGTVSRLDVATIINDNDDDNVPILGIYDHHFASQLKPYIERLESASGLIECPQARKLALAIRQENSDTARLYDSEAYRVLSYRANVISWLKGMVLYVAGGYKWDKTIEDFVRWTQQYNLWCKMIYFGQQLEHELREEEAIQHQSGPQNLLELLPSEFDRNEYRQMRASQGRSADNENALHVWTSRGYIYFDESTGRYCKSPKYLSKHPQRNDTNQ